VNVIDFSPNYVHVGFAQNLAGIAHTSDHYDFIADTGNRRSAKLEIERQYENVRALYFDRIFSVSPSMQALIPYLVTNIALPNFWGVEPPNDGESCLFNARLLVRKGADKLFELPEEIIRRTIVSTPNFGASTLARVKKLNPQAVFTNPPTAEYRSIMRRCAIVFSFSTFEMFGCSVADAIAHGALPLILRSKFNHVTDYVLPELVFDTMDEIAEAARWFLANPKARKKKVEEQQQFLYALDPERWWERLSELLP
jgi:hypothetical protein